MQERKKRKLYARNQPVSQSKNSSFLLFSGKDEVDGLSAAKYIKIHNIIFAVSASLRGFFFFKTEYVVLHY